jgi:hypothetical protein
MEQLLQTAQSGQFDRHVQLLKHFTETFSLFHYT